MADALTYLLIGFGLGGIYALVGQGLVLVYRSSAVVNFSQGALALIGAGVFWEVRRTLPVGVALASSVLVCGTLGYVIQVGIMKRLRTASALARVVATLGILTVLQQAAALRYGSQLKFVAPYLPQGQLTFGGEATVAIDRLILLGVAAVVTLVLWAVYRFTDFGLATSAVSENVRLLSLLGHNAETVAAVNWVVGGALAGAAGALVVPIVALEPTTLTLLVVPALAAAVIGNFSSFPLTFLGGLLIGGIEAELVRFVRIPGTPEAVPFLLVVAAVVIRRDTLGSRLQRFVRLPRIGTGVVRPSVIAVAVVPVVGSLWVFTDNWSSAMSLTVATATIALSLVVLTGLTGQLSLGQYAVAGLGAFVSTRLADVHGWPFPVVLAIAVVAVVPVGMLFALPALRTRGVALAVVTLGLGLAVQALILNNPDFTGGAVEGTNVEPPHVFGLQLSSVRHPERYAAACIVVFTAIALVVANVRRGRSGRRLVAVRSNERAAAALGISVVEAKLFGFGLASAIAAAGGTLLAFREIHISFEPYTPLASILLVLWSFVGGIGYIAGAVLAATFVVGSVIHEILEHFFHVGAWVALIGGILVIVTVIHQPDGAAGHMAAHLEKWSARRRVRLAGDLLAAPTVARERAATCELVVRSLTVRFGGVTALEGVDLTARNGEVVGLIGPNGAGKSTFVDAVTGLNRRYVGTVTLNGQPLDGLGAAGRARAGLGRSFQGLELFEDLSVLENLLAAVDPRDRKAYLTDLVRPGRPQMTDSCRAAIDEFRLEDSLDARPSELPYGARRLVAVARAVANSPSVLLLDEPAAGLDEVRSRELGRLIRRLADEWNLAVILIEHDVPLVMQACDRVVVLDFGRVIASGLPEEVRAHPAVRAAYLGMSADVPTGVER